MYYKMFNKIKQNTVIVIIVIVSAFLFSACSGNESNDNQDKNYGWTSEISYSEVHTFIKNYLTINKPNNAWYIDDVEIKSETPIYVSELNNWVYCIKGYYRIPDKEYPEFEGVFKRFYFVLYYDNVQRALYVKECLDKFDNLDNFDIGYGYISDENIQSANQLAAELYNGAKQELLEKVPNARLISVETPSVWWDQYPSRLIINGTYYVKATEEEKYKGILYAYRICAVYNKYYDRYDYSIYKDYGSELY